MKMEFKGYVKYGNGDGYYEYVHKDDLEAYEERLEEMDLCWDEEENFGMKRMPLELEDQDYLIEFIKVTNKD